MSSTTLDGLESTGRRQHAHAREGARGPVTRRDIKRALRKGRARRVMTFGLAGRAPARRALRQLDPNLTRRQALAIEGHHTTSRGLTSRFTWLSGIAAGGGGLAAGGLAYLAGAGALGAAAFGAGFAALPAAAAYLGWRAWKRVRNQQIDRAAVAMRAPDAAATSRGQGRAEKAIDKDARKRRNRSSPSR